MMIKTSIRKKLILWIFVLSLLFLCGCSKPEATAPKTTTSPSPLFVRFSSDVVKASAASASLSAGGTVDAVVTLSISTGYHVNANPATYSYLIATEVSANKDESIVPGTPVYPTAVKRKFQFADEPLAVYEGDAQIKLPLRAEANAAKGTHTLPLSIRIQACDEEKCFPPDTLRTQIAVEVK